MPNNSLNRPKYCHHKPSGRAYVRVYRDGRRVTVYLGDHGSAESWDRYNDEITLWLKSREPDAPSCVTVDELALLFLEHSRRYYVKGGSLTSEFECIRSALRFALASHGQERVRNFGPKMLKSVRQSMIDAGMARNTVNNHVERIRRMFRWGVESELVPTDVLIALQAVQGLRKGRSDAREPESILPVPEAHIKAVLAEVTKPIAGLIRFQLLTGARPGEAVAMRESEIDRSGEIWAYTPGSHKTEHHAKNRVIYIGASSQLIIRSFLTGNPQNFVFRPSDSVGYSNDGFGHGYRTDSYRHAIQRACDRSSVPRWHPNQLRHNAATRIRKEFGLEGAQVVLGHSNAKITEVYAERDQDRAKQIMEKIG